MVVEDQVDGFPGQETGLLGVSFIEELLNGELSLHFLLQSQVLLLLLLIQVSVALLVGVQEVLPFELRVDHLVLENGLVKGLLFEDIHLFLVFGLFFNQGLLGLHFEDVVAGGVFFGDSQIVLEDPDVSLHPSPDFIGLSLSVIPKGDGLEVFGEAEDEDFLMLGQKGLAHSAEDSLGEFHLLLVLRLDRLEDVEEQNRELGGASFPGLQNDVTGAKEPQAFDWSLVEVGNVHQNVVFLLDGNQGRGIHLDQTDSLQKGRQKVLDPSLALDEDVEDVLDPLRLERVVEVFLDLLVPLLKVLGLFLLKKVLQHLLVQSSQVFVELLQIQFLGRTWEEAYFHVQKSVAVFDDFGENFEPGLQGETFVAHFLVFEEVEELEGFFLALNHLK